MSIFFLNCQNLADGISCANPISQTRCRFTGHIIKTRWHGRAGQDERSKTYALQSIAPPLADPRQHFCLSMQYGEENHHVVQGCKWFGRKVAPSSAALSC